jgi:hypothetical protein
MTKTPLDFLVGGGEMAARIAEMDWSLTSLGPIDTWPQSLRTAVSLCLASTFPISMAWGPGHVQIYNDGYWPLCGGKHPKSMGQDYTECWASAWPAIGAAFEHGLLGEASSTGTATWRRHSSPSRSAQSATRAAASVDCFIR